MSKMESYNSIIPGFTVLAPSIYECSPPSAYKLSSSIAPETDAPSLIILCSWTGANSKHVAKYTTDYRRLFPSTRILVIATTAKDLCFRNSKRKQERLRPAVDSISSLEYLNAGGNDASILMHVFSEGGSNKACELAEAYHTTTGKRLPVSALCLDSTPGHPRYLRLCKALNKSLPQIPVLRHTGLMFGGAALGALWLTYLLVKGSENNVITRTRRRLLDPKIFDLSAPRCYLYSKEDTLIAWQDVCEHATESSHLGMPVTEELFEGSGHVGHARQEPERYWNAVLYTWRSSKIACEKYGVTVLVEHVGLHVVKDSGRWSCADSQRTLLPSSDTDTSASQA
jgi:hypothetical protein